MYQGLKPCPFCGSDANIKDTPSGFEKVPYYYIRCTKCCAVMLTNNQDMQLVINLWNTRHEPEVKE